MDIRLIGGWHLTLFGGKWFVYLLILLTLAGLAFLGKLLLGR